jgi:metal-responsive CopG/Arc/MetJ family transcriptional regulator
MKSVTVTFSLPKELIDQLHAFVERRGLSRFVSLAIEKALQEEKEALKAAYAAANQDPDRRELIEDWSALDSEGWNE